MPTTVICNMRSRWMSYGQCRALDGTLLEGMSNNAIARSCVGGSRIDTRTIRLAHAYDA